MGEAVSDQLHTFLLLSFYSYWIFLHCGGYLMPILSGTSPPFLFLSSGTGQRYHPASQTARLQLILACLFSFLTDDAQFEAEKLRKRV